MLICTIRGAPCPTRYSCAGTGGTGCKDRQDECFNITLQLQPGKQPDAIYFGGQCIEGLPNLKDLKALSAATLQKHGAMRQGS
jgi:hypothetical protein